MASNSFGQIFRITTWGESHGVAIGVVIDGCPAGLKIDINAINQALTERAPGNSPFTSPRKEADQAELLSGVFEGQTTGAPISIMIRNTNARPQAYHAIKDQYRPGHANFTYLKKYGCFDYRGGGRASARETACRVAAGAVAKALLAHFDIHVLAYLESVGDCSITKPITDQTALRQARNKSTLFCPCPQTEADIMQCITTAKTDGDSVGGRVAFMADNLPIGCGDPVYEKLEANCAKAMLSIPASKAFSVGSGAAASTMRGSEHNDGFERRDGETRCHSNHAGGTLGGISNGERFYGQVTFKPTASIKQQQNTVDVHGESQTFTLPAGSRHDPCVAIRAVPVVEAMCALTLADALLMHRLSRLEP